VAAGIKSDRSRHRPGKRALSRRTSLIAGDGLDTCPDVVLYGVRGAFEPFDDGYGGMGSTVFGVAERTVSRLALESSSIRVSLVGVSYPANAWLYYWSRRVGVRNLTELMGEDVAHCPDQRVVLVGLSQGAEVIRRALAALPSATAKRIAAVVLLGDPTRHPSDPWTHGTTDSQPGVAVRYAAPIPEELVASTWGYALDGDEIAANHTGLRGLRHSGTHTLYEHNEDRVQDRAAWFITEKLEAGQP
jgi:pimeloyl-ACP methyl ester carboxylesterase